MTTQVYFRKASVAGPNPSPFDSPITLRVVLELQGKPLQDVIDVRFTWSPIWDTCVDQQLDELEVGPLSHIGTHELALSTDPPQISQIPDPTGPTALLVSFSYKGEEFLHLGFNVLAQFQKKLKKEKNNSKIEGKKSDDKSEDEEEIPEIITSSEGVTRLIVEPCFPKHTSIKAWEAPPQRGGAERENNPHEHSGREKDSPSCKRTKYENNSPSSSDGEDSDCSDKSSLSAGFRAR